MPTLQIKRDLLFKALNKIFSDEEFSYLCFDFGLELDEIVSEKDLNEQLTDPSKCTSNDVIYKIDIPANRYDLLSLEGLAMALLVFLKKLEFPKYKSVLPANSKNLLTLEIKPNTKKIRPYALAAVLRDITFTSEIYNSFIDLQDKLHHNLARRRTLVAIGTHDLDTIKGPFIYDALPPNQIKFKPLKEIKEYTGNEIINLYSNHAQLKQYLPIIRDSEVYPVITDANGVILSMPPIINGEHSRITLNTRNIFIEVTATDLHKAHIVLDTLVTTFSQYCQDKYKIEICEIINSDNVKIKSPQVAYRKQIVNSKKLCKYIGIQENPVQVAEMLTRMCLNARVVSGPEIQVTVPPTRHDIIHAVDIYEDAAIAFGYNKIQKTLPKTSTIAKQVPVNKLSDQLREQIAQAGFTEGLTFSLCSRDDISVKLCKNIENIPAVHISNPKTLEFQVARTSLLPGLLKIIASNKNMPLPIRIFEISDIIICDNSADTGSKNKRNLCAVYYDKTSGFEKIHGLLDRVMLLLEIPWTKQNGYYLKPCNDETYFPKRCAEICWKDSVIGKIGVLHPKVLTNFDLTLPCSALEMDIEYFL